jgi:hypothetical protein
MVRRRILRRMNNKKKKKRSGEGEELEEVAKVEVEERKGEARRGRSV